MAKWVEDNASSSFGFELLNDDEVSVGCVWFAQLDNVWTGVVSGGEALGEYARMRGAQSALEDATGVKPGKHWMTVGARPGVAKSLYVEKEAMKAHSVGETMMYSAVAQCLRDGVPVTVYDPKFVSHDTDAEVDHQS